MNISSITDVIDGKLLNNPSISFIYSFKTDVFKIKTGDLLFCKDLSNIETAIKNGAFAIVVEDDCEIIDTEIAWIRVKNIQESIIKIIRYNLSNKNLKTYYCEKETFIFFTLFLNINEKNIKLIPNNLEKILKNINKIRDGDILICNNKILIEKLYPNSLCLDETNYLNYIKNLTRHSLFETTFSYNDDFFYKLRISSLYIKNFLCVYYFLNKNVDISKIKLFSNFRPYFLDSNINLVEFGKSDKFFICQNIKTFYKKEINYLKNNFSYAKILFFTNEYSDCLDIDEQIIITNIEQLKSKIKNQKFNALYIMGFNNQVVIDYFLKAKEQTTLF